MYKRQGLPFDVPVVGADIEDLSEVDYLFWVGCAGAFEDRAKRTSRAVAELLHTAGVTYAVLGDGEACTGDSARRAGNEFLFQMLAQQNVEVLKEVGATKIVVTCAHCFNTLKNEYPQLGGHYEVLHHTPVSYTHLDVYKRQSQGSFSGSHWSRWEEAQISSILAVSRCQLNG